MAWVLVEFHRWVLVNTFALVGVVYIMSLMADNSSIDKLLAVAHVLKLYTIVIDGKR